MTYNQVFVDDEDYGMLYFQILPDSMCSCLIVIGSEVFHWVSLEIPSFETEYNQVMDLYDERL